MLNIAGYSTDLDTRLAAAETICITLQMLLEFRGQPAVFGPQVQLWCRVPVALDNSESEEHGVVVDVAATQVVKPWLSMCGLVSYAVDPVISQDGHRYSTYMPLHRELTPQLCRRSSEQASLSLCLPYCSMTGL